MVFFSVDVVVLIVDLIFVVESSSVVNFDVGVDPVDHVCVVLIGTVVFCIETVEDIVDHFSVVVKAFVVGGVVEPTVVSVEVEVVVLRVVVAGSFVVGGGGGAVE